jgi:hypothetical protein
VEGIPENEAINIYKGAELLWASWSQDPIRAAVLPSLFPCLRGVSDKWLLQGLFLALTQGIVRTFSFPLSQQGGTLLKCFQEHSTFYTYFIAMIQIWKPKNTCVSTPNTVDASRWKHLEEAVKYGIWHASITNRR